jgi:hypothetical protein
MPAVAQAPIPTSETKFMFSYVYTRQSTGVFREDIPASLRSKGWRATGMQSTRRILHKTMKAQASYKDGNLYLCILYAYIYIHISVCIYIYNYIHIRNTSNQNQCIKRINAIGLAAQIRLSANDRPHWWTQRIRIGSLCYVDAQKRYTAPCSKIKACLDLFRLFQNDPESIMSCKSSPGITPTAAASAPTPFCFVPWVRTKAVAARKRRKNQTTHSCLPLAALALVPCLNPSLGGNKHMCKGQTHGSV